jgi:hypothetical protein
MPSCVCRRRKATEALRHREEEEDWTQIAQENAECRCRSGWNARPSEPRNSHRTWESGS